MGKAGTVPDGDEPPTGFWGFSLATYADPAVARVCLALQDEHGLDVNMLLFCLYAGSHGRSLSADDLARFDATIGPWRHQVVEPLRAVRRWVRSAPQAQSAGALRQQLLDTELAAERHQQQLMSQAIAVPPGPADPALGAANLARYVAATARPPSPALQAELAELCRRVHAVGPRT